MKSEFETFEIMDEYPKSPFLPENDVEKDIFPQIENDCVSHREMEDRKNLLQWLCIPPKMSSFRVNTLSISTSTFVNILESELRKILEQRQHSEIPKVYVHSELSDVVVMDNWQYNILDLRKRDKEVVVDPQCAAALLRGSHIFAPGVMSLQTGSHIDDKVSVYADLSGKCLRGLQIIYNDPKKIFIGNGILKMTRRDLFGADLKPRGVAVFMTDVISGCPSLPENCIPKGVAILQNLPSVVCGHVLNPEPGEIVLDMCAAPGNKTIHLAALMKNTGMLFALEKIKSKISEMKTRCESFSVQCARIFQFDSTKSVDINNTNVEQGPPFAPNTFDKILLDAPCSGLGQRPQLINKITSQVLKSYSHLQKKLFITAVELLKPGGKLVYSTCTITASENEEIVAWALKKFPQLQLITPNPQLGGIGWSDCGLTDEQRENVQRFGPRQNEDDYCDSVGFFIACFKKN